MAKECRLFDDGDLSDFELPRSITPRLRRKTIKNKKNNSNDASPQKRPLRSRSNLFSKSDKKEKKGEKQIQKCSITITSPQLSPIRTRNGRKNEQKVDFSSDSTPVSPISPKRKNKYEISPEIHSSTPIVSPIQSQRRITRSRNINSRLKWKKMYFSSDEDEIPTRKPRKVKKKKEFSPIKKCPDDFKEFDNENPIYYLKDNIKSYAATTSAQNRFQQLKRINELRNVEIEPKKKGKNNKSDKQMNKWAKKLNEEFSDIEKNYELCVE